MICDHVQRVLVVPVVGDEDVGGPMWSCPCGAVSGPGGEMVLDDARYAEGSASRRIDHVMNAAERGDARYHLLVAARAMARALVCSPSIGLQENEFVRRLNDTFGSFATTAAELERLQQALGMSTPFPLHEVLRLLIGATEHLFNDHNCDQHGWETVHGALDAAREILRALGHDHGREDAAAR